jgi:drug/metabolite transporter (DMT)-like permease
MHTSTKSYGSKTLGYTLTLLGGLLWAVGGSCGQRIFQVHNLTSDWLVPIRIIIAGTILLVVSFAKHGSKDVMAVWKDPRDTKDLILFTLLGAGASQYTYYTCIQYSNAAFATVISYIFPALILLYGIFRSKRPPKLYEVVSVILVTLGAFTCTTHWNLGSMSVSSTAILFGVLSAVASAYNTVKPQKLLKTYPLLSIMGWSMSLSGLILLIICRPWTIPVTLNLELLLLLTILIIGGTICAFCFFQAGVRIVGSLAGGVLAAVEPVGAVLIAVLFLNVSFTVEDFTGFVLILATIPLIAIGQYKEAVIHQEVAEELMPNQVSSTSQK